MRIVLASDNAHKLREFREILSGFGIELISKKEAGCTQEVEETGTTFAENAFIKAEAVMRATGLPAIADDSGLCVDALGGGPGVYSARYSGMGDDANNEKLLRELQGVPYEKRTGRYACAICCLFPNGDELTAEGYCEGVIGFELSGNHGFGYDPLFYVGERSFGQYGDEEKDAISHRGKALREFVEKLKEYQAQKA